jgi:hypothetical protein
MAKNKTKKRNKLNKLNLIITNRNLNNGGKV